MSWNIRDVSMTEAIKKIPNEKLCFLLGYIAGAMIHEPVTVMVGF